MTLRWTQGATPDAFALRYEVFVEEQGFSADIELDETDEIAWHVTGYEDETIVCAARLFPDHGTVWHAGRIAVARTRRGTGLGKQLVEALAEKARTLGGTSLVLGAQADKTGFYEACGFTRTGRTYEDGGAPHVEMQLCL